MENGTSYDIIGDIHGQYEKLLALLRTMGYRETAGAWRHPSRKALFAGDFVDRGPGQLGTLKTVRSMLDAGSGEAVMGNHEFNAIAFHTPDPAAQGLHLRTRSDKNRRQHQGFLAEVGEDTPLHREWIQWCMTLPLWLENADLRIVHACWHPKHMATIAPLMGPNNTLTAQLVELASRPGAPEFEALEAICKGLELALPSPMSYKDAEGTTRTRTRVRWWDESAITYRQAALLSAHELEQLPDTPVPASARVSYDQAKPVFFGHYWLTGTPRILSPKACCVDYSAAREGHPLVAYRFEGEQELRNEHMVSTHPAPSIARAKVA